MPHKPFLIGLLVCVGGLLLWVAPVGAAEWFISPTGNDANAGASEAAPFKSLSKADAKLAPGDTITVLDGTYPAGAITKSGKAGAWITIRAKNRRAAVFSVAETARLNNSAAWCLETNGLMLANLSYVKVVGLTTLGWNPKHAKTDAGHGINMNAAHHVIIQDCRVKDASGAGICSYNKYWSSAAGKMVDGPNDFITIEGNEISGCAFWCHYLSSGISVCAGSQAGLGKDPSGYNVIIRNNIVYNNENKIGGCGGPDVTYATDGNGIIVDGLTHWTKNFNYPTLVEGNLCYNNGGRGIHILFTDHVTVRYNTCWGNNRNKLGPPGPGGWKQGELSCEGSTDYKAYNNIAVSSSNAWAAAIDFHTLEKVGAGTISHNLFRGPRDVDPAFALTESGTLTADPKFVKPSTDPAAADFRLQAGSPARHAADATPAPSPDLAGTPRPQGAKNDLGAYQNK